MLQLPEVDNKKEPFERSFGFVGRNQQWNKYNEIYFHQPSDHPTGDTVYKGQPLRTQKDTEGQIKKNLDFTGGENDGA